MGTNFPRLFFPCIRKKLVILNDDIQPHALKNQIKIKINCSCTKSVQIQTETNQSYTGGGGINR